MIRFSYVNALLLGVVISGGVFYFIDQTNKVEVAASAKLAGEIKKPQPPPLETPKDPFSDAEMPAYRRLFAAYATGDFGGALAMAERLLELPETSVGFRAWLNRQRPVLMTLHGWTKVKLQDCDGATRLFYKALALDQVAEAQKGLGFCLRASKNWPEAASYLATYVLAVPGDIEGRLIYADTLESLGRYTDAVTVLEGVTPKDEQDPSVVELAKQRLQAMRAKAKSGASQRTERSEHFFVSYREDDHGGVLRSVLEILEATILEYSELLGIAAPLTPIEVILYRKEDFRDVIPGSPGWAEGVFDGRMRIPVGPGMTEQIDGRLTTVLRHELSHAMLAHRSSGRSWPVWFDEGVAQYLACRQRSCDGFRFPPTRGQMTSVDVLNQPFVTIDSQIEVARAYMHSLYLVRVIARKKGESAFADIAARMPGVGILTSDFIAEVSGWDSFAGLWQEAGAWWKSGH